MESVEAYERRFLRQGLPLLIEDWNAQERVRTRAYPLLAMVFVGELLGAVNLDWSVGANLAAVGGAGLAVLAIYLLANRHQHELERLGVGESAGFVVIPALIPLAFNGQPVSAAVTAAANVTLLLLVWAFVGFRAVWIIRFAARRLADQLSAGLTLLARAVPLLLLFAVVLFINTEMWQVFADADDARLAGTVGLLVAVGSVFLSSRVPRELAAMKVPGPPLRRLQRVNVGLVLFVSQALQVLVVALAIAVFFTAFGLVAIQDSVIESWLGHPPDVLVTLQGISLSRELVNMGIGIGGLSGLYYAIAVFIDPAYREEFLDELTEDLQRTFDDRAEYMDAWNARQSG